MSDDSELEMKEEDKTNSPKKRRIKSDSNKLLPILLGILLIVVFGGGIFYFITRHSSESDATLQLKRAAVDQKLADLEKQIIDLQGKLGTAGPDSALIQRLEALAQRVEVLEKQRQPAAQSKAKPSVSSKPAVSTERQYHTVAKGETLYRIGKKYGVSVEGLRRLNNLSAGQPLHTGQKLIVSPGR